MNNEVILNRISKNPNLVTFCTKIISYNNILDHMTARNMFLTSLVSADVLIDEHDCDETINICNFILNNIDLFMLEDNVKKDIINFMKKGIKIAKRDKKQFIINKDGK